MGLPKRRHSRARGRIRRSHDALDRVGTTTCPRCNTVKQPHVVCPTCGFYRDRSVIAVEKS